ncbi:MAG: hypothetical protein ACRC80_26500, partial [Waterburya sp.]
MNTKLFKTLLISSGIIAIFAITAINPVKAEVPIKYDQITTNEAIKGAIPITLYFGKIVSIDFMAVNEYITFIAPSDKSQFVYNTDLPVDSGEAQSVYLLPIKEIDFQGSYATSHPNLIVKTINSKGESKQYNFIINFSSDVMASTGIKIVPSSAQ